LGSNWLEPGDKKPRAIINSLYIEVEEMHELNMRLQERYARAKEKVARAETYNTENAEFIICAYGTVARICKAAINELKEEGIEVGLCSSRHALALPEKDVRARNLQGSD
jgi:2-oxoglutarate ferredoxin oxidoreductase subunit alpha